MEEIIRIAGTLPLWVYIIDGVILLGIVAVLWWIFITHLRFKKRAAALNGDATKVSRLLEDYNNRELYRKRKIIRKLAIKGDKDLPIILGLNKILGNRIKQHPFRGDLSLLTEINKNTGLFYTFIAALKKRKFVGLFQTSIEDDPQFLRNLALSCRGENFNGTEALKLLRGKSGELRELTGDPEWYVRYFAIRILLHDPDKRSQRAIWEAFTDSHALTRKTVTEGIETDEQDRLFEALRKITMDDPVLTVRQTARDRISLEFPARWKPDVEVKDPSRILHLLQLLKPTDTEDINMAYRYLEGENLELCLPAAEFLEECGELSRIFKEADLADEKTFETTMDRLSNAAVVKVAGFLTELPSVINPGSLLIAAKILCEEGDRNMITVLLQKVMSLSGNLQEDKDFRKVFSETLKAAERRGNDEALNLLNREMRSRRDNKEEMKLILRSLPLRGDMIFKKTLLNFFRDPGFPAPESLRKALRIVPLSLILPDIREIITNEHYDISLRVNALMFLGEQNMSFVLQELLEYLYILEPDQARALTRILGEFSPELFHERVSNLLSSVDGSIRAALLASLPISGKKDFVKEIRESLEDADPDVRIAGIWALVDYGETRALTQASSLLRDPVKRVRREAAKALANHGSPVALEEVKFLLYDKHEVESVKLSALYGLGFSEQLEALDILVEFLTDKKLSNDTEINLSRRNRKKDIARLIEHLKDCEPRRKERITSVLKEIGETGEQHMVTLLKEDIPSLKHHIFATLEATGYIEDRIRKLKHRDSKVREEAAGILALIDSPAAFRGIVAAARDPKESVRIRVTKALERLNSPAGKEILDALLKDPDKKVRKYTQWALERLESKNLAPEQPAE
jgi:HEAT repeat protein